MEMHTRSSEDQQVSAGKGTEGLMETPCRRSSEDYGNKDVLNFVAEDVKDLENITENLRAAYDSVITHQLDVIWISFSDCLKLTKKKLCPFVMDPFGGPAFDHLVQLNCRVIGPVCVLSCLRNSESLPMRPHPVYSVAMRKITITCTNLSKSDREEIFRKAELMGGGCTRDLTKSVTHLVVGSVGSKKYRMAASLGLPIMTTSWIELLWDHDQHNPERHASDSIYKVHQCPVFKGLSICVSQLSSEERKAIKRLVEENGGNYSGALRSNDTTHLILLQPEGDKYNHAVNWKLHCVKVDWVYDSISAGFCKDEALYRLENEEALPRVSTPRKSSSHQLNLDAEISKISSVSVSCLDETTRLNSIGQRCDESIAALVKSNKESYLHLEAFDVALLSCSKKFLDGCKILIIGFNDTHSRLLSKMVAQAGGVELKKYSENVSHVIFGEKNAELIENIKFGSSSPHVVSCQWLIDCFNAQKVVSEMPYLYMGDSTVALLNQDASLAEEKENNFSGSVPQKTVLQNTEAMMNGVSSIMKECLAFEDNMENKSMVPQQNDPKVLDADQEQVDLKNASKNMVSVDKKTANDNFSNVPSEYCEKEEEGYLSFKGTKFVVVGFGPMDTDILTDMIVSQQGDVYDLNAESEVDIAIVPIFWEEQPTKAKTVATNCWLQTCIEDEKLLTYDENPLFKPLGAQPCSRPLENCVVSISQYTGIERDCLRHIAEVLGAVYQEHFVRKASRKSEFKPSTHLVVPGPEGGKYEAAKKWNIPAVTKDWIIDAAKYGELPPAEAYLVEGSVLKSQSSTSTVDCYHSVRNDGNQLDLDNKPQAEYDVESKGVSKTPNAKVLCGNRLKELIQESKALTNKNSTVSTAFLNPDVPYHPDFSVGDMLDFLDSPCNPGNNGRSVRKQSIPIEEMFSHNLSLALEKFSSPKTHSGHGKYESSNSPSSSNQKSPPCDTGPLAGVIVSVSNSKKLAPFKKELQKTIVALGGVYQCDYNRNCTHFVCQAPKNTLSREMRLPREDKKLIVAPEWIIACRDSWKRIEEALYPPTYKSNVPLAKLMTSKRSRVQGNKRTSKDSETEKNSSNEHQEEENLDVSRQLDALIVAVKSATDKEKPSSSQVSLSSPEPKKQKFSQISLSSPDPKKSTSSLKRDKSKNSPKASTVNKKSKNSPKASTVDQKSNNSPKASTVDNEKASVVTSSKELAPPPRVIDTASSEPSQFAPITWEDPTRQCERDVVCKHVAGAGDQGRSCTTCFPPQVEQHSDGLRKTVLRSNGAANSKKCLSAPQAVVCPDVSANNKQRSSEPPQPTIIHPDVSSNNRQRSSEPPQPTAVCPDGFAQNELCPAEPQDTVINPMVQTSSNKGPQKRFMFSGFSDSEKEQFSSVILKYGGEISTDKSFDKTATHLILGKPLKNEKLLSSVASGKWVLHKSYIEAVEKHQAFVDEEDYEWGNKSTDSFLTDVQNDSETAVKVAHCPQKWRMKINNENLSGAFSKWNVIIFSEKHKVPTYCKILRAGDANVYTVSPSLPSLNGITHALIEPSCVSTMDINIKLLMSSGVMCLKPEYLAYYLIEDPSPPEEDYLLPEAAEYLNSPRTASVMSKRRQNFSDKGAKKSRVW